MNEQHEVTQRLVLCDDRSLGRIDVDLQNFFELSFAIAEDFEELLEQFRLQWGSPPQRGRQR